MNREIIRQLAYSTLDMCDSVSPSLDLLSIWKAGEETKALGDRRLGMWLGRGVFALLASQSGKALGSVPSTTGSGQRELTQRSPAPPALCPQACHLRPQQLPPSLYYLPRGLPCHRPLVL